MTSNPLLIVLSGPSGVGKDSVISRMLQTRRNYHVAITATSRPPRPKEQDGIDYIFLSTNTFREMIERNEFLEWAIVHGNYYGVPNTQVLKPLGDGKDVIVKPDVQGAASIKKLNPNAILIFLSPLAEQKVFLFNIMPVAEILNKNLQKFIIFWTTRIFIIWQH